MPQRINKKAVKEFLMNEYIMSLATMSDKGPHCSILMYYITDDFSCYFITHAETYKAKNIIANPKVSLCVWQKNNMFIQADGDAVLVEDELEKTTIVDRLAETAAKDPEFWPPVLRSGGVNYAVFKITPTWLRALDLSNPTIASKESPYITIEL